MRRSKVVSSKPSVTLPALSADHCLAKTWTDKGGISHPGRSVYEHSLIVGSVARELTDSFPAALRQRLIKQGCSLLAACHDVGKISPSFYLRLHIALNRPFTDFEETLLATLGVHRSAEAIRNFESGWSGHSGVSALTLMALTGNKSLSVIVGQHHGCRATGITGNALGNAFGGEAWFQERKRLVQSLQNEFGTVWPENLTASQSLFLAGLTSVADWIGSGSGFDDPTCNWKAALQPALEQAGQTPLTCRASLTFEDLFHDRDGQPYHPNEAQCQLYRAVTGPGVYVLEAPMGMGKTEAALYAAYKMLAAGEARGIYFALPTQLTSEKIYQRFGSFLNAILEPNSHQQPLLLHGKAPVLQDIGEEGKPGGGWFASRKRGLLAPFAVGTLDQALMAAMNVKHGFVRAFGLAGKVVILDEIHSYDAYTGVIVKRLVDILRDLHCTVIILSATLTQSRRETLLNTVGDRQNVQAYPLISAQPYELSSAVYVPLTPPPSRQVMLTFAVDGNAEEEALLRAEQGQQILWIENTVNDAQLLYRQLAARCRDMDVECGLLHSRFTLNDRQQNEAYWVSLYGQDGWSERTRKGRILIGTQVLEQSIDIDADFLITRFAPTDMLMQRIGRLWRHAQTPRPKNARCETWILAPDMTSATNDPYQAFHSSAWVYAPYVLCRSLDVWREHDVVTLPSDIRPMLEATYTERQEEGAMKAWKDELFNGRKTRSGFRPGVNALQQLARLTLSNEAQTLPESKAQTRYSEQDDRAFLLLRAVDSDAGEKISRMQLLSGGWLTIPWRRNQLDEREWRRLARQLESEQVRLRASQFPQKDESNRLWKQGLEHLFYCGNSTLDEPPEVMVAIVDASGGLCGVDGEFYSTAYRYSYRADVGLGITKKEE